MIKKINLLSSFAMGLMLSGSLFLFREGKYEASLVNMAVFGLNAVILTYNMMKDKNEDSETLGI